MVFFDANVPIEVLLERKNMNSAVKSIYRAGSNAAISALTGHQIVYFGVKELELSTIRGYLRDFSILSLEQVDFDWAFANRKNDDFEDALQLAVAIRNGCSEFVTFDRQLYNTYKSLPQLTVTLL